MDKLNHVFNTTCRHIEGLIFTTFSSKPEVETDDQIVKQKTSKDPVDTDAMESVIVSNLRAGIASLDSKQPETVICWCLRKFYITLTSDDNRSSSVWP